jgi:hypothetical protein
MLGEVAHGERHADRIRREGAAVGPITCTSFSISRAASLISAVTVTSPAAASSTILSSAASAVVFATTICVTIGSREGRIPPFETITTGTL